MDDLRKKIPLIIALVLIFTPILKGNLIFIAIIVLIGFFVIKNIKKINNNSMKTVNLGEGGDFSQIAKRTTLIIILVVLLLWLAFSSLVSVGAGKTGVYSLFGKVSDRLLASGLHVVNPLGKVDQMSIRTEEYTMSAVNGEGKVAGDDSIQALTKEGLNVSLDITVLYRLEESKATEVYRTVGLNYEEKIVRPEIRSTIREVVSQFTAKEIYSEKREEANDAIFKRLSESLSARGMSVESILLRNVSLPDNLAKSIQEKLQAEQEAQKYDFILEKEKKEKQRKVIEAEGQRDSQKIINESLSPNYLYYLYIRELKDRQGTIYIPTSPTTGMPVFKDLGK